MLILIVSLTLLGQTGEARAADVTSNPSLNEAIRALQELDNERAQAELAKARRWPQNTPRDLALIHMYDGLLHAAQADERGAKSLFRDALLLDPGLRLPEYASPRIRQWWREVGGQSDAPALPPQLTPVEAPDPEPPALTAPAAMAPPPPDRTAFRIGAAVTMAGGVAASTVAIVFAGQGASLVSQYREEPHVGRAVDLHRQAEKKYTTANWLAGVGGTMLLVGTGALVFSFSGP